MDTLWYAMIYNGYQRCYTYLNGCHQKPTKCPLGVTDYLRNFHWILLNVHWVTSCTLTIIFMLYGFKWIDVTKCLVNAHGMFFYFQLDVNVRMSNGCPWISTGYQNVYWMSENIYRMSQNIHWMSQNINWMSLNIHWMLECLLHVPEYPLDVPEYLLYVLEYPLDIRMSTGCARISIEYPWISTGYQNVYWMSQNFHLMS